MDYYMDGFLIFLIWMGYTYMEGFQRLTVFYLRYPGSWLHDTCGRKESIMQNINYNNANQLCIEYPSRRQ